MGPGSLSIVKLVCFDLFFFMFLFVLLGCLFGACGAYFPYFVGSVELFVVFFVFNLKKYRVFVKSNII